MIAPTRIPWLWWDLRWLGRPESIVEAWMWLETWDHDAPFP